VGTADFDFPERASGSHKFPTEHMMEGKSGNAKSAYKPLSRAECQELLRTSLLEQHLAWRPTHFLTIRLYSPADRRNPIWLKSNERTAQLYAGRHIIKLLDNAVYGAAVRTVSPSMRFNYFLRLETIDRRGNDTQPHFHLFFNLTNSHSTYLGDRIVNYQNKVNSYLVRRNFQPDFMLEEHDGNKKDYLTKYSDGDVMNIFTRELPIRV
jgi:hypothetical protein